MLRKNLLQVLLAFFFIQVATVAVAQDGKALFKDNCAACHAKDMKTASTGPALGGAEERWADYPKEDLYSWIRNSAAMIESGHPRAKQLWGEWGPTVMTAFPNLKNEDIDALLVYINEVYVYVPEVTVVGTGTGTTGEPANDNTTLYFGILVAVLALLAIVLARIIANLNYMAKVKAGEDAGERQTLVQLLTDKRLLAFLTFLFIILTGYTTVNNAINLGRQQGYAPVQPIKFSHVTHAGENQIDCQYCHDGARRSKHSVIPATNTCMNCHAAIKDGSKYGRAELTKIYASAGFDPTKGAGQYIENYADMKKEDIEKIFRKWLKDGFAEDISSGKMSASDAEVEAEKLLSPVMAQAQMPIEWTRIHNLPDHVYFNHAQHVTVGKVECENCHGKVEEMEVVQQYSPLSMGWCINCHRQTEVQFDDNEYYEAYQHYQEDLESGKIDKVTVEDIGGLECQKCHY
jgi:mono/diheme cytochrome c family protein